MPRLRTTSSASFAWLMPTLICCCAAMAEDNPRLAGYEGGGGISSRLTWCEGNNWISDLGMPATGTWWALYNSWPTEQIITVRHVVTDSPQQPGDDAPWKTEDVTFRGNGGARLCIEPATWGVPFTGLRYVHWVFSHEGTRTVRGWNSMAAFPHALPTARSATQLTGGIELGLALGGSTDPLYALPAIALAKRLGAGHVRIDEPWWLSQPAGKEADLSRVKTLVDAAHAAGMQVELAIADGGGAWCKANPAQATSWSAARLQMPTATALTAFAKSLIQSGGTAATRLVLFDRPDIAPGTAAERAAAIASVTSSVTLPVLGGPGATWLAVERTVDEEAHQGAELVRRSVETWASGTAAVTWAAIYEDTGLRRPGSNRRLMNWDGSPRPAIAAFRTCAELLRGTTYAGTVALGDGYQCHRFTGAGAYGEERQVLVAWATHPAAAPVTVDIPGTGVALSGARQESRWTISNEPSYAVIAAGAAPTLAIAAPRLIPRGTLALGEQTMQVQAIADRQGTDPWAMRPTITGPGDGPVTVSIERDKKRLVINARIPDGRLVGHAEPLTSDGLRVLAAQTSAKAGLLDVVIARELKTDLKAAWPVTVRSRPAGSGTAGITAKATTATTDTDGSITTIRVELDLAKLGLPLNGDLPLTVVISDRDDTDTEVAQRRHVLGDGSGIGYAPTSDLDPRLFPRLRLP